MYAEERLKAEVIQEAVTNKRLIISCACRTFLISQTCYRYESKLNSDNELITDLLIGLTQNQRNWGFGLCFLYFRNINGWLINEKRPYKNSIPAVEKIQLR